MYSSLYQFCFEYLYPGKIIRRTLRELEDSQWLPRPELEVIQLRKIQRLLSYAYENVPFYRQRYQKEGIHPRDIKSLKDFQAIPFLTRDDVKSHYQDLIATGYRGSVFEGQTSGSTGTPMHFIMDRHAERLTFAYNARCRGWYGVKLGDKRAYFTATSDDNTNHRWRAQLAANIKRHRYINIRTMTESAMQAFAGMLVKWQPDMFRAYPSALTIFADFLKERNIKIRPKLVETTAEKAFPSQRKLFEEVFQAPVADHYASLEIFSYAYQCPDGGLHVNEDRYLELEGNDGVVEPGQLGEVVVTSLNQYAMPFIRYLNGDVAIYEPDGCPCGRGMPVLREVVGRTCDLLVHPDGHVVHWSLVTAIMMPWKKVRQYQIYQPDRTNLEVRLDCTNKVDSTYLRSIGDELQGLFGRLMKITVKKVDHIEPTAGGKHRYVISDVKPDL